MTSLGYIVQVTSFTGRTGFLAERLTVVAKDSKAQRFETLDAAARAAGAFRTARLGSHAEVVQLFTA